MAEWYGKVRCRSEWYNAICTVYNIMIDYTIKGCFINIVNHNRIWLYVCMIQICCNVRVRWKGTASSMVDGLYDRWARWNSKYDNALCKVLLYLNDV